MIKKIPILIVDDEADLLEMYRELLEMENFQVFTALSAQEGMKLYSDHREIQLIISDSNMGDMSGIEFLMALKSTYQRIPVFYIATGSIEQSEDRIKSLGGDGLVLKPFDLDEILIKIRKDLKC